MKNVVDTNRIIAALVKDSTTRSILFDKNFEFITPDYTIAEINGCKNDILEFRLVKMRPDELCGI